MVKVKVIYDYDATQPDELTIKIGDIISDVKKLPGGWWEGGIGSRRGVFPDNFVEDYTPPANELPKGPKPGGGKISELQSKLEGQIKLDQPPLVKSSKPKQMAVVLFEYRPEQPDELELMEGDTVEIIKMAEEGWWEGVLRGKSGMFPSNFVKLLDTPQQSVAYPPGGSTKQNDVVHRAATGGRPPAEKPKMPLPVANTESSIPPPQLPKRNRESIIEIDSYAHRSDSDSDHKPAKHSHKKKLKTRAERDQLIGTHVDYSSSDNTTSNKRSKHRQTRRKSKHLHDGDKAKLAVSTSGTVGKTLPPSHETLIFWGRELPEEVSSPSLVNKAQSLGAERLVRSALSIKNKASAPAKLVAAESADARISPLARRARSKSSSKSVDNKKVFPDKDSRSKSRTDERTRKHSTSKKPEEKVKKKTKDSELKTKTRDTRHKTKAKDTGDHDIVKSPERAIRETGKSPERATKSKKKSKRGSTRKKTSKEAVDGLKLAQKRSPDRTLDNIPPLPEHLVAPASNVRPVLVDNETQSSNVSDLRGIYEEPPKTTNRNLAEGVHWSTPTASLHMITPNDDSQADDQTLVPSSITLKSSDSLEHQSWMLAKLTDSAVQCDGQAGEPNLDMIRQMEKLSSIEQAVNEIQSTVSGLTTLVETLKSEGHNSMEMGEVASLVLENTAKGLQAFIETRTGDVFGQHDFVESETPVSPSANHLPDHARHDEADSQSSFNYQKEKESYISSGHHQLYHQTKPVSADHQAYHFAMETGTPMWGSTRMPFAYDQSASNSYSHFAGPDSFQQFLGPHFVQTEPFQHDPYGHITGEDIYSYELEDLHVGATVTEITESKSKEGETIGEVKSTIHDSVLPEVSGDLFSDASGAILRKTSLIQQTTVNECKVVNGKPMLTCDSPHLNGASEADTLITAQDSEVNYPLSASSDMSFVKVKFALSKNCENIESIEENTAMTEHSITTSSHSSASNEMKSTKGKFTLPNNHIHLENTAPQVGTTTVERSNSTVALISDSSEAKPVESKLPSTTSSKHVDDDIERNTKIIDHYTADHTIPASCNGTVPGQDKSSTTIGYIRLDDADEENISVTGSVGVETALFQSKINLHPSATRPPEAIGNDQGTGGYIARTNELQNSPDASVELGDVEDVSTTAVMEAKLAREDNSVPAHSADDDSFAGHSEAGSANLEDVQLPIHVGKKKPSLKSRLAKAFGIGKKNKSVEESLSPKISKNSSIDVDDLFASLPPPTRMQRKSTWGRKKSKKDIVINVGSRDSNSISSIPQHPPPPPPNISSLS